MADRLSAGLYIRLRISKLIVSHVIALQEYRGDGSKEKPFIVRDSPGSIDGCLSAQANLTVFQITWLPEDPENPQTYSNVYKWTVTMIAAIVTLAVALASSAYSGAVTSIREDFNVQSEEVIILGALGRYHSLSKSCAEIYPS